MRVSWRGSRLLATFVITAAITTASATARSVSESTDPTVLAKTLHSTNPTEAAAAAYWLGFKGRAAVPHIPRLIATLGDNRAAKPSAYRHDVPADSHSTPGEEAAAALARIGQPAVEPLIEALRTSSSSVARQNAAWALGQIDKNSS